MLRVTTLPAAHGDCLWVEYGDAKAPRVVLIDAGPVLPESLVARLKALKARDGRLELVVLTHIDADHIAGMLTLLETKFFDVPVADFWFNGFRHLPSDNEEVLGAAQGEKLTAKLLELGLPWNDAFKGDTILVEGAPPTVDLAGGARITVLSPDAELLRRLRKEWVQVCANAELVEDLLQSAEQEATIETMGGGLPNIDALADAPFKEDRASANGSSIALTFEFAGRRILFGADAYPSRLSASLALLGAAPHRFDLAKVPHHGSDNNVSAKLIRELHCPLYVFSSNGAQFKHPSPQAVARVIKYGQAPTLAFNYRTEFNEIWDEVLLQHQYPFAVEYGAPPEGISHQFP